MVLLRFVFVAHVFVCLFETFAGCPKRFGVQKKTRRQLLKDVPSDFVFGRRHDDIFCIILQAVSLSEEDMTTSFASCPKRFRFRKKT